MFIVHETYIENDSIESMIPRLKIFDELIDALMYVDKLIQDKFSDQSEYRIQKRSINKETYTHCYDIFTVRFQRRIDIPYVRLWIQIIE